MNHQDIADTTGKIAVVGMAARLPQAHNVEQFWQNLIQGRECITRFTLKELGEAGFSKTLLSHPNFVGAWGTIDDIYSFDASLFGYSPREAELLDPQHRVFLECVWEALEDAGYNPHLYAGRIGLFAGSGATQYLFQLLSYPRIEELASTALLIHCNDKDFLTTRAAYKLNLRGPCVTTQTACSTSLVSIVLGCQSLLTYQTDIALAGGVDLAPDETTGYIAEPGGVMSPDGHCRAFDAAAKGIVGGSGVGLVVLKRLEDALLDRDTIHAVVIGFGLNNDGTARTGYTAPGFSGQVTTYSDAIAMAGINPETIGFIECHGTGTPIGDPIELSALTTAFRTHTKKSRFCVLGSVKTNIGHVGSAAGVAGFLKAMLALKNKSIPPTLHFQSPNPSIDLDSSPFYVNTEAMDWKQEGGPRRAGVTSLGIGGTNAHIILEEAPQKTITSAFSRPWQLLVLSAHTEVALRKMTENLIGHLKSHPENSIADVAYTLQMGRQAFPHRQVLLCRDHQDAVASFETSASGRIFSGHSDSNTAEFLAFLFPGYGSQYVYMGRHLYLHEPAFRDAVNQCVALLSPRLGVDLTALLYPPDVAATQPARQFDQIKYTHPALFIIEYALAKLLMQWGLQPKAMIGHSLGEYVAACLAGVFSLENALSMVSFRAELMQQLPPGSMLAVSLSEKDLRQFIEPRVGLSLASVSGPAACVVSGGEPAISELETVLTQQSVSCRRVRASRAFHSQMMDPVLPAFREHLKGIKFSAPSLPFLSNVSGTWISESEVTSPEYWVTHLRETVRFSAGISQLVKRGDCTLLEVGAESGLGALAFRQEASLVDRVFSCLPSARNSNQDDMEFLLRTMAQLWTRGLIPQWTALHSGEERQRIPLPTYSFDRKYYRLRAPANLDSPSVRRQPRVADWLYAPGWQRASVPSLQQSSGTGLWMLFLDSCGVGLEMANQLRRSGNEVVVIAPGDSFKRTGPYSFVLAPGRPEAYKVLVAHCLQVKRKELHISHLWSVIDHDSVGDPNVTLGAILDKSFYSLIYLGAALGKMDPTMQIRINVVSNNLQDVCGDPIFVPERAALFGPCKALQREYPNIKCHALDILLPSLQDDRKRVAQEVLSEFGIEAEDEVIAYRGGYRWVQTFAPVPSISSCGTTKLRKGGVYLITGGLGGLGLFFAEQLARCYGGKLVLIGRSDFPRREDWPQWLRDHESDDAISRKIAKLQDIEKVGGEVVVKSVDVCDEDGMKAIVRSARDRFGAIHGVIHTAAVTGGGIIELKSEAECAKVLKPKLQGTLALARVLSGVELDFLLLCSSMTAILGAPGQVDYIAANAFLDSFAHVSRQCARVPAISVNWCGWREIGMRTAPEFQIKKNNGNAGQASTLNSDFDWTITPQEGWEVLQQVLSGPGIPQLAISPVGIEYRRRYGDRATQNQPSRAAEDTTARPGLSISHVAPEGDIEQHIAAIAEDLLGMQQIRRDDDFHALGLHSLLAVGMVSRIRRAFGIELTVSDLYHARHVAGLAQAIRSMLLNQEQAGTDANEANREAAYEPFDKASAKRPANTTHWFETSGASPLVTIRPEGSKPSLFMVHAAGGGVKAYYELAKHLAPLQPLYAFQNLHPEIPNRQPDSVEDLAKQYATVLSDKHEGPYLLGGWSMGGVVAFEMALQLVTAGKEIPLVVMLDAPACALAKFPNRRVSDPEYQPSPLVLARMMAAEAGIHLQVSDDIEGFAPREQLDQILRELKSLKLIPSDFDHAAISSVLATFSNNLRILRGYVPKPYSGHVVYLRAESSEGNFAAEIDDPIRGWQSACHNAVEFHSVPGNHFNMFSSPFVQTVGHILQNCIDSIFEVPAAEALNSM